MRVSTIKAKKIDNLILPEKVEGSYWISGTDTNGITKNLISIEAENNKWKLISNEEVYCTVNGQVQPFVYLEVGRFYTILNEIGKETFLLYCSPVEMNYQCYDIQTELSSGITIGSNQNNTIIYQGIDDVACKIQAMDNKIYVLDNKSRYGVYLNNIRVNNVAEIKVGDIIFLAGLKIVLSVVRKNQNIYSLYINNKYINNCKVSLSEINSVAIINSDFSESNSEVEFPLYDENEYFHKIPRFYHKIEPLVLQIDPPPAMMEEKETSVLLTIGPMITMSMTSLVSVITAINNVNTEGGSWAKSFPTLLVAGAMFASVFIWPMLSKWFNGRSKKKQEKLRKEKYSEYIARKKQQIIDAKNDQSAILRNNSMQTTEAVETILKRYTRLWQRRVSDDDFLEVNLGNGSCPMAIDIKYPEDHFSMTEDILKTMVSSLEKEPKMLTNVPILLSLAKEYITGFIGKDYIDNYVKQLLIQMLALHSYDDLKIVLLTDEEKAYEWNFIKHTPHNFSDDRSIRFFATNSDEYKEVCYYLDRELEVRKGNGEVTSKKVEYHTHYLIITDSFKKVKSFDIINNILTSKEYYGFSLAIIDSKLTNLPDQCETFITINKEGGELKNNQNMNESIFFAVDVSTLIDYESCAKALSNIPIEINNNTEAQLTSKVGFLEMYDVGKIEQLNSLNRWKVNNPILNLQVPVGMGKNGEKISIDLHEKYHGPHGLIAGMTGSGKSEFIITYILSMAINYHPYEVQFVLIDYKGGGLAGAFENKMTGLKLPHLVGTITNLDANEIKRSLASIDSELKRRQALFNKAREISGESTIDIYKYQRMFRDGQIDEPISHLFIISDEFAELKSQQPEFMEQLISTARIGRSLGVHLILATQKPSGVVDPQIWSNTRFRVCLRVQDKGDSNEVIKSPDAAFLKQTGRFFFQVGFNEVFELGQAAYAGGRYIPTEKVIKSLDTSIDFIDNIGYTTKKVDTKVKDVTLNMQNMGEELINIVKYLDALAKEQNIRCKPLWLEKIADDIKVEELAQKYQYQKEQNIINPIVGEFDIPSMQQQRLLTLPLTKDGNAIIYGASGSGKENFITTMIYASQLFYSPDEVNYYVVDFGSESLKMFEGYPIVGDILNSSNDEAIKNLYKMAIATMEERKRLFQNYNGDYATYCKNSGKTVPAQVIVINNYEAYQESYGDLDDILIGLTRECNRYGIYFVLAVNSPNGVRFKLKQNFATLYALQQNSDDDYTTILGNVHKNYPAKIFGRGIFKIKDVYEFQTALVTEKDDIIRFVKSKRDEFISKFNTRARNIPVLPEVVGYPEIAKEFGISKELIVGINKNNLLVTKFDFIKNYISIITGLDINSMSDFVNPLINQIIALQDPNLIVINADDFDIDDKYKSEYNYIDGNYNDIFNELLETIKNQREAFKNNNYNKRIFDNIKKTYCIIIGVDSFRNRLNESNRGKFDLFFNSGKDMETISFILIDSLDKIKKIELEPWYKNSVNTNYGIWIGNGINDQYSIKINQKIPEMKENIPEDFCFVIKRGRVEYIKYVSKLDLNISNKDQNTAQ